MLEHKRQTRSLSSPDLQLSRRELLLSLAAASGALTLPGCKKEGEALAPPSKLIFDPAYGELVSRDPSIPLRQPMPQGFVRRIADRVTKKAATLVDPTGEKKKKLLAIAKREVQEIADEHGAGPMVKEVLSLNDEEMVEIGRQAARVLDKKAKILPPDHPLSERVSAIVSPHRAEAAPKVLSVKIYDDPIVNAFALPDGSIRLYRGLVENFSDDEVRAVFGHEFGHVVEGHSEKRMRRALLLQAGGEAVLHDIFKNRKQGGLDQLAASAVLFIGEAFAKSAYSRKNEVEADDYSFAWAMHHGYDLRAQVTIFENLQGSGGGLLSSHPASEERAERNRARLASIDDR